MPFFPNCASTLANHTSGDLVQNSGSLMDTLLTWLVWALKTSSWVVKFVRISSAMFALFSVGVTNLVFIQHKILSWISEFLVTLERQVVPAENRNRYYSTTTRETTLSHGNRKRKRTPKTNKNELCFVKPMWSTPDWFISNVWGGEGVWRGGGGVPEYRLHPYKLK